MTRQKQDTTKAQDFAIAGIRAISLMVNGTTRDLEWEVGMMMTLSLVKEAPEIVGPFAALLVGVDDDQAATKARALKIMRATVEAYQIPAPEERNNT